MVRPLAGGVAKLRGGHVGVQQCVRRPRVERAVSSEFQPLLKKVSEIYKAKKGAGRSCN